MGKDSKKAKTQGGNSAMCLGAGIGVYGVTMATLTGYVCPVCVIAAPTLIASGFYQKYLLKKKEGKAPVNHKD